VDLLFTTSLFQALVVNQLVIFTSTINPSIGFGIGLCFALLCADLMRVTFYYISLALSVRLVQAKKKIFEDVNDCKNDWNKRQRLVNVMRSIISGFSLCLLGSSNAFLNNTADTFAQMSFFQLHLQNHSQITECHCACAFQKVGEA